MQPRELVCLVPHRSIDMSSYPFCSTIDRAESWHVHLQGSPVLASANVALGLVATGCDDVYSAMLSLMAAKGVQLPVQCAYDQLGIDQSIVWARDPELAQLFAGDAAILSTLQMPLSAKIVRYTTLWRSDILGFCWFIA